MDAAPSPDRIARPAVTQRVVIVGGGTAGWMAAAALARFVPASTRITLIESDAIGTVGVGEATIPGIRLFNQMLGLDEAAFLRATHGSFKLGIRFEGWSGDGSGYLHAFGSIGRGLGLVPFHHYWLRGGGAANPASLWGHMASAQAAMAGRFAPDPGRPDLPSGLAWAYHFDASLYAALLRRHAEAAGVVRVEGRIASVARDMAGRIDHVALEGGHREPGDLFIDCSGFRGLLIGETLAEPYDDWSDLLPCDRALAVAGERASPLPPYTRAIAHEAGWRWRIPLQHRTGNGLVYDSRHLSEDEATDRLLPALGGEATGAPRLLRFTTGRRRRAWVGNCVALGLAAGFLEPLESTSIHLIQSAIARLLDYWPGPMLQPVEIDAYNRLTEAEWLGVRDFLILHYHANARPEPFWVERRAVPLPDSLAARIALFRANGRIQRDGDELFAEPAWAQVMIGQGILPAGHHALADAVSPDELDEFLTLTRRHAAQVAARLPTHDAFLTAHCAAPVSKVPA
ncbi:tryptophan halogenase family protein [Sphingomonas fuzhouensis]|uniref:tryptophan halogenase family protein n=1 Tax=Sphingomonas fuzhouensis TaxID=3106033 RepID=UPI002AFF930D|nr:tryptophan halogenase family protein [Sphingomonas sp. SGZ-02]